MRAAKAPKILAFTPTYGDGPRPETLASVQAQTYRNLTHEVSWANPYPGGDMRNVLAQFQRGRQMALDGGYAALWTVEHDMDVPPDALQTLWDTGAQVVYGVYVLRHGVAVLNAWEWLGKDSVNIGESLSLHPKRLAAARAQASVQVGGVGFGCTLIRAGDVGADPVPVGWGWLGGAGYAVCCGLHSGGDPAGGAFWGAVRALGWRGLAAAVWAGCIPIDAGARRSRT